MTQLNDIDRLKNKRLFLFDIDGVIKIGNTLIDGALELYNYINDIGGKSIFITNNATKNCASYVDTFLKFGFDVDESNFETALSVSARYLQHHHSQDKIFAMGTQSLVDELIGLGLNVTTQVEPDIDVVLVGYDSELNYQKLSNVCEILQTQQVTYLATNLDLRCPIDFGFVPDCGSMVEMIKTTTGKQPKFLGKPSSEMVDQCLQKTGYEKDQAIVIGDRLYTDIACGNNAGVDTCVVFTGEVQPHDLDECQYTINYVFDNVRELLNELKN